MSDDSDEDNTNFLQEALDSEFINNEMYMEAKQITEKTIPKLPSLRPRINEDDQFNMLNVSPQFQEYVAKQLASILDRKLNKRLIDKIDNTKPKKRHKSGIKLFKSSSKFVKLKERTHSTLKLNEHSESDDDLKCREVAVNAEDILSKKDVASWSTRKNPKIFKYNKDKNGILNLIN